MGCNSYKIVFLLLLLNTVASGKKKSKLFNKLQNDGEMKKQAKQDHEARMDLTLNLSSGQFHRGIRLVPRAFELPREQQMDGLLKPQEAVDLCEKNPECGAITARIPQDLVTGDILSSDYKTSFYFFRVCQLDPDPDQQSAQPDKDWAIYKVSQKSSVIVPGRQVFTQKMDTPKELIPYLESGDLASIQRNQWPLQATSPQDIIASFSYDHRHPEQIYVNELFREENQVYEDSETFTTFLIVDMSKAIEKLADLKSVKLNRMPFAVSTSISSNKCCIPVDEVQEVVMDVVLTREEIGDKGIKQITCQDVSSLEMPLFEPMLIQSCSSEDNKDLDFINKVKQWRVESQKGDEKKKIETLDSQEVVKLISSDDQSLMYKLSSSSTEGQAVPPHLESVLAALSPEVEQKLTQESQGTGQILVPCRGLQVHHLVAGSRLYVVLPVDTPMKPEYVQRCSKKCATGDIDGLKGPGYWFSFVTPQIWHNSFYGRPVQTFILRAGETLVLPDRAIVSWYNLDLTKSIRWA